MTLKQVKDLQVNDLVMGTDDKPHRVTAIGNWGRGAVVRWYVVETI